MNKTLAIHMWSLHSMQLSTLPLSSITTFFALFVVYQRSRFMTWSRNAGRRVNTTTSFPKSCWISTCNQILWRPLNLIPPPQPGVPSCHRRRSQKSSSDLKRSQRQVGHVFGNWWNIITSFSVIVVITVGQLWNDDTSSLIFHIKVWK